MLEMGMAARPALLISVSTWIHVWVCLGEVGSGFGVYLVAGAAVIESFDVGAGSVEGYVAV